MQTQRNSETNLRAMLESMTVSKSTSKGLYLYGVAGCGKSTIAWNLYKALENTRIKYGFFMQYVSVPEMLLEFRECYRQGSEEKESQILNKYSQGSYLFLDDFGAEKKTEFSLEALHLLLSRWENKGKLIITSNLSPGDISETMSDRIASRVAGLCDVVKILCDDFRVKNPGKYIVNENNKTAIEYAQRIIDEEIGRQRSAIGKKVEPPAPEETLSAEEREKLAEQMRADIDRITKKSEIKKELSEEEFQAKKQEELNKLERLEVNQ